MHLNTNHRHSSHCRRLSIWGSIPNPCRPLSAAWVAHGTCAFLLCNVPTFQPFPCGLRLAEEGINFGGGPKWCDVEADETTFDRKDLKALAPDKNLPIVWEQWRGLVKRGDPKSLVLKRLVPRMSEKRAPGPGAIRKVEWAPLAKTYLQDKQVILHTDAAKTYKMHIPGVVHDNVIHAKKRVKINGKWRWQNPSYVRIVTHKVPGVKKPIKCKAGTQIIDRAWKFLKDRLPLNQNCKVGSAALRTKLRSAQYEYWHKNDDLWLATGVLCSWEMVKFQLRPWKRHRIAICVKSIAACLTHSPEQCSNKKS